MSKTFATGIWNSQQQLATARRGVALFGIFAILLQAVLIGWHHHPLPLSSQGASGVLTIAPPAGHSTPAPTDDDCQICFALSHHSAAPGYFCPALVSQPAPLRLVAVETVWVLLPLYILFRSRAPPRV